jgi:hypothetical protein
MTGLVACAGDAAAIRGAGSYEHTPQCPPDETWSCIEKLGKTVSCSCSSRDELRRILEPERH